MDKRHFSFFESYHEAFKNLSPEEVGYVVKALGEYFFNDAEIELEGISKTVFALIKPIMDSSKQKSSNGAKGGAPQGNSNASKQATTSKKQPKNKQKTTEKQAKTSEKQAKTSEKQAKTSEKQAKTSDKEREKDKDKESLKGEIKRFAPPSSEDVRAYCQERKNNVDPETFVDFYTAKGWKVGNNPMKDWKACVRTWEKRDSGDNRASPTTKFQNFEERNYDMGELERRFARN